MPPRILTDEHLSPTIGPELTNLGYDVVPVHHRGLLGWEDWDLMAWCIREQRAICTNNARDFEREHRRHQRRGQTHCGILIVGDWSVDKIYWALRQFLESQPDELLLDQLIYLSKAPPYFIAAHPKP